MNGYCFWKAPNENVLLSDEALSPRKHPSSCFHQSESWIRHGGGWDLPDDHVTALSPLWRRLSHFIRVLICIVTDSEVDVSFSAADDQLRWSNCGVVRRGHQTTWSRNDKPDRLPMSMIRQLCGCSGAVWNRNCF